VFLVLFASLFPLVVAVVRLCRESFRCFSVAFSLGFHFSLIMAIECATTASALVPNLIASFVERASVDRIIRKRKPRNENRSTCRRLGSSFDPVAVLWFGSAELVVIVPCLCRLRAPRPWIAKGEAGSLLLCLGSWIGRRSLGSAVVVGISEVGIVVMPVVVGDVVVGAGGDSHAAGHKKLVPAAAAAADIDAAAAGLAVKGWERLHR
jgi:hypothetical protein